MHDLIEWYKEKKANPETNPILLAAEFHYKFIRIHPFDDGNGRTARILMNFILMQYNYPPVIIKTQDKENYFGVLRMADAGNIEAFVNYIAENLNRSLEIMIAGAKGENIEEEDDLDKEIALLKHKLDSYSEKIEKVKSEATINNIFKNSLQNLAHKLKEKFTEFETFYLKCDVFIEIGGRGTKLEEFDFDFNQVIHEVGISVFCNKLKLKGLEDFQFTERVNIEFNELYYTISEKNQFNSLIYKKNYENLLDSEIDLL